jgi:CAAX protease family protein
MMGCFGSPFVCFAGRIIPLTRKEAEMAADLAVRARDPNQGLVAPLWHTALLLVILAALVVGGARLQSRATPSNSVAPQHAGIVPLYFSVIILEWALVCFVWFGLRRRGTRLRDLIGGRWGSGTAVLLDVAIALGFWIVWEGVGKLAHLMLGPSHAKTIEALLPQGAFEVALWIAVSISAGFGEEVVYRGYLQKQILALSASATVAVLGQAILFGLSHAYQGAKQVIVITVLGAVYGLLPLWRKSLRPNIIAHAWSDVFSGLLSR